MFLLPITLSMACEFVGFKKNRLSSIQKLTLECLFSVCGWLSRVDTHTRKWERIQVDSVIAIYILNSA